MIRKYNNYLDIIDSQIISSNFKLIKYKFKQLLKLQTMKRKLQDKEISNQNRQKICEVCFISTEKAQFNDPKMELITCKKCKKNSHRICYNSTIENSQFQCDLCRDGINSSKSKECYFCHNHGLLKKIQNMKSSYAHPICLLINLDIRTKSFMTLEFQIFHKDPVKQQKQTRCYLCQHQCSYGYKCWNAKCKIRVHIFCLIKQGQQDWCFNLKQNQGFAGFTQNILFKCLTYFDTSKSLQHLTPDYKKMEEPGIFYCGEHKLLQTCICQWPPQQEKIQWIQCDRCKEWYHTTCIKNDDTMQIQTISNQEANFICEFCYSWEKVKNEKKLFLKRYPRLQLYDHIYIHQMYQKGYDIPKDLMDNELICHKIQKSKGTQFYIRQLLEKNLRYLVQIWDEKQLLTFSIRSFKIIEKIEYIILNSKQNTVEKEKQKIIKKYKKKQKLPEEMLKALERLCSISRENFLNFQGFIQKINNVNNGTISQQNISQSSNTNTKILEEQIALFETKLKNTSIVQNYKQLIKKISTINDKAQKISQDLPILFRFINDPKQSIKYMKVLELIMNLYSILNCNLQQGQKIQYNYFTQVTNDYQNLKNQFGDVLNQLYFKVQNSTKVDSHYSNLFGMAQQIQKHFKQKIKITYNQFKQIKERELELKLSDSKIYLELNTDFLIIESQLAKIINKLDEYTFKIKKAINYFLNNVNSYRIIYQESNIKVLQGYLIICNFIEELYNTLALSKEQHNITMSIQHQHQEMISVLREYFSVARNKKQMSQLVYHQLCEIVKRQIQIKHKKLKIVFSQIFSYYLGILPTLSLINIDKIRILSKIMIIFEMNNSKYQQCIQKYDRWFQSNILQIQSYKLDKILEQSKQAKKLLQLVRSAINNSFDIENDITHDINRLKLLEIRLKITIKSVDEFIKTKDKIKVLGLKELIKIAKESGYPKNKIYQKLIQLDEKANELIKKADVFSIKKTKKQIQGNQELLIIEKKLTIAQSRNLETELKNSLFDFDYKIDDINQQIKKFEQKQKSVQQILKKQSYQDIYKLYKYYLETPLKYDKFIEIRDCVRKLKCNSIPRSRKELQLLINWGAIDTLQLLQKTQDTRNAYKKIDLLEDALKQSRSSQYIQIQKLKELTEFLLQDDLKQKLRLREWQITYVESKNKYEEKINSNCNINELENIIKDMKSTPIRNDKIQREFNQKKRNWNVFKQTYEMVYSEINQDNKRLSQTKIFQMMENLERLHSICKYRSEQYQFLKSQYNCYKRLKESILSKNTYYSFLKDCWSLKTSMCTTQLINIRRKAFEAFKSLIYQDISYQFCKRLEKQILFLIENIINVNQKKQLIAELNQLIQKQYPQHSNEISQSHSQQDEQIQSKTSEQECLSQYQGQDQLQNQQQISQQDQIEIESNKFEQRNFKRNRITGQQPDLIKLRIGQNPIKKRKLNNIVILEDS